MAGVQLKNQEYCDDRHLRFSSKTVISPFDMLREGPLEFFVARKPCLAENKVLVILVFYNFFVKMGPSSQEYVNQK